MATARGAAVRKATLDPRAERLAHYERRLLEERRRIVRQLGRNAEQFGANSTEADGDLTSYPFHMADAGTDAMEQEKSFLLASHETRTLWQIDDALRRLYRSPETFDVCEHCGQTISFERLDAIPYTRYCVACKHRG
jgi:RNA polymerase-binding transcription factor DksA